MPVDQLPPGKARPAKSDTQFVRYDEFIDKQIETTRRTVKMVDVLTALLVMAVGTLGFLLTAAVFEHWLVPGGFNVGARLLLFVILVGCLTFYTTRRLWPLLRGSINPAYAAQAIEHENPSLKNSLLNLLLFRQNRDEVTDAVYETLEQQAAHRLTRVPIDSAVDRTQLLRLGYALIFILAVVALYKILSPKDPFASAERVLMPWARIVAPSRVAIENVEPGNVTLARGEVLSVAADVRGIGDDDPVIIRYTTADGQAVDRPAPMTPSTAGLRFNGQIPPAQDASTGGIAQNLRYHIEAGDARSLEYTVTVVAAPTITVERIDYDYPDYTQFADRGIDRLGDIRAIEGTRVTIHARANQPIEAAAIDFEADGRRDVQLTADGNDAKAGFLLELRDDRQTPKFTSYALRFTGSDGRPNRDPVKFPIDVLPDLSPEAAILAPAEKVRDVRLDETVAIEIDARDPDFALAEVRLEGEAAGSSVFNEKLLARDHVGRFTGRHMFTPNEHDLQPGDIVRYWVTVRDNRAPKPNETTTDSQTLRIVGPNPNDADPKQPNPRGQNQQQDRKDDKEQQSDEQQEQPQGDSAGDQSGGQSGDQSGEQSPDSSQGQNQQRGESASADGQSAKSNEQSPANQSQENGSGEKSENQSGETESDNQSSGDGQSSASEQGGESGEAQQQPGGSESAGDGKPGEQSGSQQNQSQQNSGGEPNGESNGEQGDSQSKPGQPGANNSAAKKSGEQQNGEGKNQGSENAQPQPGAEGQPKPGEESSPVSSEGDNDGEAFERIQDFLKKEGQLPKESEANEKRSEESDSQPGESASADENPSANQNKNTDPNDGADSNSADNANNDSQLKSTDPSNSKNEQPGSNAKPGEASEKANEPSNQNNQPQPKGSQQTNSQGESGAGDELEQDGPEQGQGAPESQDLKPSEKWQQRPSDEKQGENQEAPSGGQGKRESDSQGDQGGDHAGGGEEGGGQKSNRDGTGSAGQNQSADEGAGESSEQGAGRNSESAGQDAKSKDPTGQSSENEPGEGSSQRDGEGEGDQPGGSKNSEDQAGEGASQAQGEQSQPSAKPGEQPTNQPASEEANPNGEPASAGGNQPQPTNQPPNDSPTNQDPQSSNQSQGSQDSGSSAADGAGQVPDGVMRPSGATGDAPAGDAANLEYARKQTDLVLETLAEQMQRQKVDKRLLDKLGWTEADLKRFLERWQQLKASARDNSPADDDAQRELDDALRSLGLRRGNLQQSKVSDDRQRNLRQGYRGAVPPEYQERLRAYNQGVSRARQADE